MAYAMTKRGNQDNVVTYEFICDTTADLQAIQPEEITIGSVAIVIEGDSGFEVYMANSKKEWIILGGSSSSDNSESSPTVDQGTADSMVLQE